MSQPELWRWPVDGVLAGVVGRRDSEGVDDDQDDREKSDHRIDK